MTLNAAVLAVLMFFAGVGVYTLGEYVYDAYRAYGATLSDWWFHDRYLTREQRRTARMKRRYMALSETQGAISDHMRHLRIAINNRYGRDD